MQQRSTHEPTNHCDECGLDFFYAAELHTCAPKKRVLAGESWVDECMRKQYETRS